MAAAPSAGEKYAPFAMVFGGCMSAIIAMEYVLKDDPNAGNLLTLTEFAFVMFQSIPGRMEAKAGGGYGFRPLLMPWVSHAQHAALWVSMSVLANYVFGFNITVPIHTLFRSCNVIASVLLGWLAFQQRYSLPQVACILVITVGIFLGSMGDAKKFAASSQCLDCGDALPAKSSSPAGGEGDFAIWCFGVGMLVVVQMLQALLGHTQAIFYKRFQDKGSRNELSEEFLFTSHVVSFLPFVLLWEDILVAAGSALQSPPVHPLLPVPTRIAWLLVNNLCQTICIKGVFRLSAHYSPLTVNITLSVRKFLSVVVSILWFGNPWTGLHSVATAAIFGGVFAYSQCPPPAPALDKAKKEG